MKLLFIAIIVLLFNIPFGYWRAGVRKFSIQWILAIHLPVPFVIIIRIYSGLGFKLYTFPIIIFSYFSGQYIGAKLQKYISKNRNAA